MKKRPEPSILYCLGGLHKCEGRYFNDRNYVHMPPFHGNSPATALSPSLTSSLYSLSLSLYSLLFLFNLLPLFSFFFVFCSFSVFSYTSLCFFVLLSSLSVSAFLFFSVSLFSLFFMGTNGKQGFLH